jgi:small subunit ribosomal protein S21
MNKFVQNDGQPRGLKVEVYNNDISKALRKLKKKIADDGIMQDIRAKEFFESKSVKRRKAKEAAIRRYAKNKKAQDL